jgi:hypothetical protein
MPRAEIYSLTKGDPKWRRPPRQTQQGPSKDYCEFHGGNGHRTEDCRHLKDAIEELISEGHLSKFKARAKPEPRQSVRPDKEKGPAQPIYNTEGTIEMILSTPPRKEVFARMGTTAKDGPATVFNRLGNGNSGRSVGDAPSIKPTVLDQLGSKKPYLERLEGGKTILERLGNKKPVFERLGEKPQIAYQLGEKTSAFERIEFIGVVQEGDMLDSQPESFRSRKRRINERIHQISYKPENSPCPPDIPDLTISLADYEQSGEPHNSPLSVTLDMGRF